MRIPTKLEHAGFIIEADNGRKLAIDIGSYSPLEKLNDISIDAMIISHFHKDHFSLDQIKKLSPKKLYLSKECIELIGEEKLSSEIIEVKFGDYIDIDGIKVLFFEVDHGPNVTARVKENFGFLIEADGKKVYFGGDIYYPSGVDVATLEVDYALLPVGGYYTFGPKEALNFASQFKKIGNVIPMHYEKTPENRDEFIKLAVEKGINTESFVI